MNDINYNDILGRNEIANDFKSKLQEFEKNKYNLLFKRGFYIYGGPGSGKTTFVKSILKELGYDIILFDAGDIRNKSIIDSITHHSMSEKNIISLFNKETKPLAIIMDEIDGMNNGDKGGINALIKLIRPKKTKKQKLEPCTYCPIICISNYHIDKKISELMKTCHYYELKAPSNLHMKNVIEHIMPKLDAELILNLINYVQSDLRKLSSIYDIYVNRCSLLKNEILQNIFRPKSYNFDSKLITKNLLNNSYSINDHNNIMNDTDRTIVGLLYHENIIDTVEHLKKELTIPFYREILNNICYADYIDRITFQKQIWQFNEMSSLIKTFQNNYLAHKNSLNLKYRKINDIRFTKILTKYSTEYNNEIFIQSLSQKLSLDKKDMIHFFLENNKLNDDDMAILLDRYEITKLDITRIKKYVSQYFNLDDDINYNKFEIDDDISDNIIID